jgi:hypothetical protein
MLQINRRCTGIKMLALKPEEERPLRRTNWRCKMFLRERSWEGVDWIY